MKGPKKGAVLLAWLLPWLFVIGLVVYFACFARLMLSMDEEERKQSQEPFLLSPNQGEGERRRETPPEQATKVDFVNRTTSAAAPHDLDAAYVAYLSAAAKSRWVAPMEACALPPYSDDWVAPLTHRRGEPLLIFSYPKVGSSTTQYYFLLATSNPSNGSSVPNTTRTYFPPIALSEALGADVMHLHHSEPGFARAIKRKYHDTPIWIITIVRNRFIRDISALLESASYFDLKEDDPLDVAVSRLKRWFYQLHDDNVREATNRWYTEVFMHDLQAMCGCDPVNVVARAARFNWTRRSLFFRSGRFRVLQLRFEDLQYWDRIWAKFFPDVRPPPAMPHQRLKIEWRRIRNFQLLAATAYSATEIAHRTQDETSLFYTKCENEVMAKAAASPINIMSESDFTHHNIGR